MGKKVVTSFLVAGTQGPTLSKIFAGMENAEIIWECRYNIIEIKTSI